MKRVDLITNYVAPCGGVMQLKNYPVIAHLRPFVARIYDFFSPVGMPVSDLQQVVPDGNLSWIFPYYGSFSARFKGITTEYPASVFGLKLQSAPVYIDFSCGVGLIGLILNPATAYRLCNAPMNEVAGIHSDASDILGGDVGDWAKRMADLKNSDERVEFLENSLLRRLSYGANVQPIVEFAMNRIRKFGGLQRIDTLSRDLGISRRYLEILFRNYVGLSPQEFAKITRFHTAYAHFIRDQELFKKAGILYEWYHDQAHFIRDFQKFTDFTPNRYMRIENEFRKILFPDDNLFK